MSDRHEMMDICDRCGKRFNPVSCGGLVTFKMLDPNRVPID